MAAILLTYGEQDIFNNNIKYCFPVAHILSGIESATAIITSVSVRTAETTQFFLSFGDVIHYLHFGKGLGEANISGIAFVDCNGEMPGLSKFFSAVKTGRGKIISISFLGGGAFKGPLIGSQCTVRGEPETMAEFNISMAITSSSYGGAIAGTGTGANISSSTSI